MAKTEIWSGVRVNLLVVDTDEMPGCEQGLKDWMLKIKAENAHDAFQAGYEAASVQFKNHLILATCWGIALGLAIALVMTWLAKA